MSQRIAVLGATGVYARHLIPRLLAAGHSVRALARQPAKASTSGASSGTRTKEARSEVIRGISTMASEIVPG